MKPLVFASYFESFCSIRVEEKCDRNVPAAGPAWLGAPGKTSRQLDRTPKAGLDDWGPGRGPQHSHGV
jgi:hypothetical protein